MSEKKYYSSILKRMATLKEIEIAMHKLAKQIDEMPDKDQDVVFKAITDRLLNNKNDL